MDREAEVLHTQMEAKRASLADKIGQLETAVSDTVSNATSAVTDTVSSVKESVSSTLESVQNTFSISYQTQQRPWVVLGAAVAVGFLTGRLLHGGRRHDHHDDDDHGGSGRRGHGGGGFGGYSSDSRSSRFMHDSPRYAGDAPFHRSAETHRTSEGEGFLSSAAGMVSGAVGSAYEAVKDTVGSAAGAAFDAAKSAAGGLASGAGSAATGVAGLAHTAVDAGKYAAEKADGVYGLVRGLLGPEVDRLKDTAMNSVFGVVKEMVNQSPLGNLGQPVTEMVNHFATKLGVGPILEPQHDEKSHSAAGTHAAPQQQGGKGGQQHTASAAKPNDQRDKHDQKGRHAGSSSRA